MCNDHAQCEAQKAAKLAPFRQYPAKMAYCGGARVSHLRRQPHGDLPDLHHGPHRCHGVRLGLRAGSRVVPGISRRLDLRVGDGPGGDHRTGCTGRRGASGPRRGLPPGRPHLARAADVCVPARRLDAHPRQHVVPVDLREQRGGLHGPPTVPDLPQVQGVVATAPC